MPPKTLCLTIVLGLVASLASGSARAAGSSARCDDMLIELGATQAALSEMEAAVTTAERAQQELRVQTATLAATIAERLRDGATEPQVQPLMDEREAALAELAQHERLLPILQVQLDALTEEVALGERGYITCVESSLD